MCACSGTVVYVHALPLWCMCLWLRAMVQVWHTCSHAVSSACLGFSPRAPLVTVSWLRVHSCVSVWLMLAAMSLAWCVWAACDLCVVREVPCDPVPVAQVCHI